MTNEQEKTIVLNISMTQKSFTFLTERTGNNVSELNSAIRTDLYSVTILQEKNPDKKLVIDTYFLNFAYVRHSLRICSKTHRKLKLMAIRQDVPLNRFCGLLVADHYDWVDTDG